MAPASGNRPHTGSGTHAGQISSRLVARSRRGGALGTAMGLGALGVAAALAGAFLVGPMLQGMPGSKSGPVQKVARKAPPVDGADRDSGREVDAPSESAEEEPVEVQVEQRASASRPEPASTTEARVTTPTTAVTRPAAAPSAPQPAVAAPAVAGRPGTDRQAVAISESRTGRPLTAPAAVSTPQPRRPAAPVSASIGLKPQVKPTVPAPAPQPPAVDEGRIYRVKVGVYGAAAQAEALRARLASSGIPASVVKRGKQFAVQAGSYRLRDNAERVAETLRHLQLKPEVTER